ncbi:MAG: AcrR family transcriptional regulator [Halioglobus sp.]|jgi:AcrR family transcriptional regulator
MSTAAQSMPDKNTDTRERLLLTALHLYAVEGLHAVSLRRISSEAGSKNSAAMHYHFENKMGVIKALMKLVTGELVRIDASLRAQRNLPGAIKTDAQRSLREATRDTIQPLIQLPTEQVWGMDAVHFLSRLVSENDKDIADMVNTLSAPFWQRIDKALATQLTELPKPLRRLRVMFMTTNVLHGVAEVDWLRHTPLGDISHFDDDTLLDHLVDYLIGGLQAPSPVVANP